jgi:hypothetical protein
MRFVFLALLAACGDDGAPRPDAPRADAATDAQTDAPAACTTPNECPCFSNDDCPDGTRCHAADPDNVYCEPGPRGTGAAGVTCAGENDCASALCVEGSDVMRCSRTCTSPSECPAELPRCLGGLGICARNP